MAGTFAGKYFNSEVFTAYLSRVPNLRLNRLLQSGAIRNRQELASSMRDQVSGNYISTPLRGLIDGEPQNYDGQTDIDPTETVAYMHSRVVVGREKAWSELDFTHDITGGVDFWADIAAQVNDYWATVDQNTIVSILKGVFSMSGTGNVDFVNAHTHNVCGVTNADGKPGYLDAATLNTAMQKASGDRKGIYSAFICHSVVATHLENANALARVKVTRNGMEQETDLATIGGKILLIDDSMPMNPAAGTPGVYTVTVSTALTSGDSVKVAGVTYSYSSGATTASAQAAAIAAAINADNTAKLIYTASASEGVVTLTEKSGHYGTGAPALDTSGLSTGVVAAATTTEGAAAYTSFILGAGAFEFTRCDVNVPSETHRDPMTKGGKEYLITRQRKCWAPYGISFTKYSMSTASPSVAELENGLNWELVHSPDVSGVKYLNHRAIPIARVLSLG